MKIDMSDSTVGCALGHEIEAAGLEDGSMIRRHLAAALASEQFEVAARILGSTQEAMVELRARLVAEFGEPGSSS